MRYTWIAVAAAATIGAFPTCRAAPPEQAVFDSTVISRRDPAIEIKLPSSVHYVGSDHFLLNDPKLGDFDACHLYAFVDSDDGTMCVNSTGSSLKAIYRTTQI